MIKEIKYNGFTETPSDYECPDGDLATVTGLVPEDEALHPVQPPVTLFTLPPDYNIAHIHKNTGYKHYIIRHDYQTVDEQEVTHQHYDFYYISDYTVGDVLTASDFTSDNLICQFTDLDIYNVNSIGNTIVILTSDGMYYFLWRYDNTLSTQKYKALGNNIPETHISFGLQGSAAMPGEATMWWRDEPDNNMLLNEFGSDYENNYRFWSGNCTFINTATIDAFTNIVMGKVNSFIQRMSIEKGKFIFPFMVRYAYRLYDETLTMHSQPVLMITDSYMAPHCFMGNYRFDSDGAWFDFMLGAMLCDLDYKAEISAQLADWGDIVKSVDIFISAPLYTYNQAGKIKGWSTAEYNQRGFGLLKVTENPSGYQYTDPNHYCKWYTAPKIVSDYGGRLDVGSVGNWPRYGKQEIDLPRFTDTEMNNKIRNCHEFYLFKSIPIDELATANRTILEMPSGTLATIVNQEAMNDDLDSHNKLIPKYSFTYNNRLNIAGISKELRNPFRLEDALPYVNYTWNDNKGDTRPEADPPSTPETPPHYNNTVYITIEQNNKEYIISSPLPASELSNDALQYFYFPNTNAKKCTIKRRHDDPGSTTEQCVELQLLKHDFLNGAVFFQGFSPTINAGQVPTPTTDNVVETLNMLYTSEVDNPFVFPNSGRRAVGMSSILGIRPAVKAMSPSQFGQFKFYAFTKDGVWALEVNSEGYLESPQLVAPDIVLGDEETGFGKSITQIDGAVLFASDRGIMMLNGSQCTCISDILNSQDPFVPFGATASDDVLPGLRSVCGFALDSVATVPFRTFIQDCSMLYDYPHQRIILYSPSCSYAYAFSTKSKLWGMIPSAIHSTILDYPYATCMVRKASALSLADYSKEPSPSGSPAVIPPVQGLIITRPLKLDMPDVLKTVESIIQRGNFKKGHVQTILYGSRDLQNWLLIKSSVDHYLRGFRGTPFKYFRIALLCQLDDNESVFGCSIQFNPRYQNKLR